jgi:hypothetical protein
LVPAAHVPHHGFVLAHVVERAAPDHGGPRLLRQVDVEKTGDSVHLGVEIALQVVEMHQQQIG